MTRGVTHLREMSDTSKHVPTIDSVVDGKIRKENLINVGSISCGGVASSSFPLDGGGIHISAPREISVWRGGVDCCYAHNIDPPVSFDITLLSIMEVASCGCIGRVYAFHGPRFILSDGITISIYTVE